MASQISCIFIPTFWTNQKRHASYFSASKSALTAETLNRSLSFCCTRVRLFAMPVQPEHHKHQGICADQIRSIHDISTVGTGILQFEWQVKLKHQSSYPRIICLATPHFRNPRFRISCWIVTPRFVANPPLRESVDTLHWPQDEKMGLPGNVRVFFEEK